MSQRDMILEVAFAAFQFGFGELTIICLVRACTPETVQDTTFPLEMITPTLETGQNINGVECRSVRGESGLELVDSVPELSEREG